MLCIPYLDSLRLLFALYLRPQLLILTLPLTRTHPPSVPFARVVSRSADARGADRIRDEFVTTEATGAKAWGIP
jgi:hypothetical protein